MTETAPERIWATGNGNTGSWNARPATFSGPTETQFVRADLLDESEKALEEIASHYTDTGLAPLHMAAIARATLAKLRSKT